MCMSCVFRLLKTCCGHCLNTGALLHVCMQVGSLNLGDTYAPQFAMFYRMFCQRLLTLVNPDMDLRSAYDNGTEDQQVFVQNLSLFFTQFFKVRAAWLLAVAAGDHPGAV